MNETNDSTLSNSIRDSTSTSSSRLPFTPIRELTNYDETQIGTLQTFFKKLAIRCRTRAIVKEYSESEASRPAHTRVKILLEFLSTEETYVKGLKTVIDDWLIPLRTSSLTTKNPVCSKKEVDRIFGSIEVVYKINVDFLHELKAWQQNKFPQTSGFADILFSIAPALYLYVDYVNNYDEARDTFDRLMKDPTGSFHEWVNNQKSNTSFVGDLTNLLITPVQRVPRYELLIRELIKHTEECHLDYLSLIKAKDTFVKVNKTVNTKKRELETRRRLVELERSIVSDAPLILVAPHRMYIKDGLLRYTYHSENKDNATTSLDIINGNVYILNDSIVLTKSVPNKVKDKSVVNILLKGFPNNSEANGVENRYIETISLKDLEIIDVSSGQLLIQFSNNPAEAKCDFFFENEDIKREWYTAFKEAIDAYALTALFEGMYKEENRNFVLISAYYGKLKNSAEKIDVTDILQKIMEQQGGDKLILNSGSKAKLFKFSSTKKLKKQLVIKCSIKNTIKEFVFQDSDSIMLNEDS